MGSSFRMEWSKLEMNAKRNSNEHCFKMKMDLIVWYACWRLLVYEKPSLAWIVAEHPFWKNLVGRHNLWEPSRTDLNRYAPWIFNGDARILNSHLDRNTICKPGSQPCLSAQWIVLCGPAGVATDKGLFPIFSTSVISSIYPRDKIMIHTVASFISMIGPNQTRIDEWCIWIQVGSWGNCEFSVQAAKCPPRTRNMNRRHK